MRLRRSRIGGSRPRLRQTHSERARRRRPNSRTARRSPRSASGAPARSRLSRSSAARGAVPSAHISRDLACAYYADCSLMKRRNLFPRSVVRSSVRPNPGGRGRRIGPRFSRSRQLGASRSAASRPTLVCRVPLPITRDDCEWGGACGQVVAMFGGIRSDEGARAGKCPRPIRYETGLTVTGRDEPGRNLAIWQCGSRGFESPQVHHQFRFKSDEFGESLYSAGLTIGAMLWP